MRAAACCILLRHDAVRLLQQFAGVAMLLLLLLLPLCCVCVIKVQATLEHNVVVAAAVAGAGH